MSHHWIVIIIIKLRIPSGFFYRLQDKLWVTVIIVYKQAKQSRSFPKLHTKKLIQPYIPVQQ